MKKQSSLTTALVSACLLLLGCGSKWVRNPARESLQHLEGNAEEGSLDVGVDPEVDNIVDDLATHWRFSLQPVVAYFRRHWRAGDPKSDVAGAAVESVARVRDRRAIPCLVELSKEPEEMISGNAVISLRSICEERDLPQVLDLIQDDRFRWKTQMTELLAKFARGEHADSVSRIILMCLRSENAEVRRGAALAMKRLGDRQFIADLNQTMSSDAEPGVRVAAAEATASLGDPRGADYLLAQLELDADPLSAARACYAVGRLKLEPAVEKLKVLVKNAEEPISTFAAIALRGIGTEAALTVLRDLSLPLEEPGGDYALDRDRRNWL